MASKPKKTQSNRSIALVVAAVVIAAAAVAVLLLPDREPEAKAVTAGQVQAISPGGSMVIPVSEVTETASFYPVTVDGTPMEVLAIRDGEGSIRTAFNTCQSCYTSGQGYYTADGTELVCHNCGFRFTAEQVQVEGAGGCNPYPIFPGDKTETETEILISYDVLKSAGQIFANWKR